MNLFLPSSLRVALAVVLVAGYVGCASKPQPAAVVPAAAALRTAQKEGRDVSAVGHYLDAAREALAVATDGSAAPEVRAAAQVVYDDAVSGLATTLHKEGAFPGGTQEFKGAQATYLLHVAKVKGVETRDPRQYQKLLDATRIYRKHLSSNTVRGGIGAPLVGVMETKERVPNRPVGGFAMPLTAVASFGEGHCGMIPTELAFYNPEVKEQVKLEGRTFPLAGDFTAPIAYLPKKREVVFGMVAMFFSDQVAQRQGIYFLQPYDPNKIPILFIHGLMSSPHAFIRFVNDLNANAEFRKRYQPWVLFYPSGGPIAANAGRLRKEMSELPQQYPMKKNIVVVGHSMGGLLTRLQVTDSKRILWDRIFKSHADRLYKTMPDDALVKRALVFKPNPYIKEVVFFSVPHRGSRLADLRISAIAGRFIRMPAQFVKEFNPQMRSLVANIDPHLRTIPTSIMSLSPKNPLLKAMDGVPMSVPYHSVIGNEGKDNLPLKDTTDGIVAYWSSHQDGAVSELVVPTGHNSFDHPKSVAELLRILGCE